MFLCVCCTNLLKTRWEKEKLLVTSNYSFPHSVFDLFRVFSAILIRFSNNSCRLQTLSVWMSLKFVILERVNTFLCPFFLPQLCPFFQLELFINKVFVAELWHLHMMLFILYIGSVVKKKKKFRKTTIYFGKL